MIVILPLPRMAEVARWSRVMPQPLDVLPGGIRDLAFCALQNQTNFDSFMEDALVLFEEHANDDMDYPVARRVARLMKRQDYMFLLEIMLNSFYDQFLQLVRPIFGNAAPLYPQRMVSYYSTNSICVELTHEPTPRFQEFARFAYCPAR